MVARIQPFLATIGVSIGAAGWILGAANELSFNRRSEAGVVFFCAIGVIVTGIVIGFLKMRGTRFTWLRTIQILLASSFVFGSVALWFMYVQGVIPLATTVPNQFSEELAFAILPLLLGFIALGWYPPVRGWFERHEVKSKTE